MTFLEIKEEVERTRCEYSRSMKGTEERLARGKEFIKALNVAIGEIEKFLQGSALILDAEAERILRDRANSLKEYQDWSRSKNSKFEKRSVRY